ncbi:MAG: hypothetical protein WC683_08120 [bacterium]
MSKRDHTVFCEECGITRFDSWVAVHGLCPDCAEKRIASLEAQLARVQAALARYAPTDEEARSTDELAAAYFAFCQEPNRWASLYAEECGEIAAEWDSEGSFIAGYKHAPTARAALQKALAEREATP